MKLKVRKSPYNENEFEAYIYDGSYVLDTPAPGYGKTKKQAIKKLEKNTIKFQLKLVKLNFEKVINVRD